MSTFFGILRLDETLEMRFFMNMQNQTRKAFGHYAKRQIARVNAGNLGHSELHPSLKEQVDDLESASYVTSPAADERPKNLFEKHLDDLESSAYVTPDSALTDDQLAGITADIDAAVERYKKHSVNGPVFGESIARAAARNTSMGDLAQPVIDHQLDMDRDDYVLTAEDYARLAGKDYVAPSDDYALPSVSEVIAFREALVGQDSDNLSKDVSGHGSPDVIIARPDVAKELGSTFVNDFGDVAKVVSSDDIAMGHDGDSLPDEKNYSRLAKRARGYAAGNLTNDYVQSSQADDYVQPPKADEYVTPPKDMSFTDALVNRDNNKVYVGDHMRSFITADDTIFVTPEAANEMGSVFVDDFGNHGKVVVKDQIGKQARDYTAGNLTDDYVTPPKYDDYVQPPKADEYVAPPKYDDYVQPPTVSDFDASQFEMSNNEAAIDDEPMSTIDEGQFDIGPSKGLQQ